VLRTDR